jgi:4'-phosphopantetheinyl transferase
VWFADLASVRPAHLRLLNDVEQERRGRYRQEADRARFTVGAALLRLVVADELGVGPTDVRVDRTCARCGEPHGKPRVSGADVYVSISHSGDKVALALTREAAIGVDVEAIGVRDVAGLARTVLVAAEPLSRPADFFTYWCRKEAIVKATGDGLQVPLIEVVVSAADEPARLITYRGAALISSVCDLPIDGGYAAALAVLAEGEIDVSIHQAADVLSRWDG